MRLVLVALCLFAAAPAAAQDHTRIVEAHRRAYPTPLPPSQAQPLLREIAADLSMQLAPRRFGILIKTSGNNCGGYSCDIICSADGQHWDVLADSPDGSTDTPGPSRPAWQDVGAIDPARCELVAGGTPTQPDPDPDPQPGVDVAAAIQRLEAALAAIAAKLELVVEKLALLEQFSRVLHQDTWEAKDGIRRLLDQPLPTYQGKVLGQTITLTPKR